MQLDKTLESLLIPQVSKSWMPLSRNEFELNEASWLVITLMTLLLAF